MISPTPYTLKLYSYCPPSLRIFRKDDDNNNEILEVESEEDLSEFDTELEIDLDPESEFLFSSAVFLLLFLCCYFSTPTAVVVNTSVRRRLS